MIECIHCGEEVDIGSVGHDKPDGELHATLGVRRGFRESGGVGRIHAGCFNELFGKPLPTPGWAKDD